MAQGAARAKGKKIKKKAARKRPASEPDPDPVPSSALAQTQKPDPEPGRYPGVPRDEYFSWPYANNSMLGHFEKSAAHALVELTQPKPPTPAQVLGTHIHLATLSEDLDRYAMCAPINPKTGKQHDRRTIVGRVAWAETEQKAAGREILSVNDYNACKLMRTAWRSDPVSNAILSGRGMNELAIVWDDIATGIRCKALIDRLTEHDGWTVVADLKSTKDASPDGWPYEVLRYRHHRQAAFYLDGIATLMGERPRRFVFLAMEKQRPFCPVVYVPTDGVIEQGRMEYRALLKRYKRAIESGEWPGYPNGIQFFHLPERGYRFVEGDE